MLIKYDATTFDVPYDKYVSLCDDLEKGKVDSFFESLKSISTSVTTSEEEPMTTNELYDSLNVNDILDAYEVVDDSFREADGLWLEGDEPEDADSAFDLDGSEFDYFDEHPEDDPFQNYDFPAGDAAWQNETRSALVDALSDFLTFGSVEEVLQMIVEELE